MLRTSTALDQWGAAKPLVGQATGPACFYRNDKKEYYLYYGLNANNTLAYQTSGNGHRDGWSSPASANLDSTATQRGFLMADDLGGYTMIYDWSNSTYWQIATQRSQDGLVGWQEKKLCGLHPDSTANVHIPWIYRLEDGTYRLYFTGQNVSDPANPYYYLSYVSPPAWISRKARSRARLWMAARLSSGLEYPGSRFYRNQRPSSSTPAPATHPRQMPVGARGADRMPMPMDAPWIARRAGIFNGRQRLNQ